MFGCGRFRGFGIWWFRVWGFGLHFQNMRRNDYVPFSERYGYRRVWYLGRFKVKVLYRREVVGTIV